MTNNRNISLDILRILACLGVIVIHTAGSIGYHRIAEAGTFYWNICEAMDALSRWSVPVFAMLSGFFFLQPEKEIPIKKLYGKYIAHIVVALVFWSLFYAITLHKSYYPFGVQEGHFWYLGMCIGLYMAMPVLRWIATNEKVLAYFCWVWFFCKTYIFLGNFVTLPIQLSHLLFVDYVGYCLWAHYLSRITLSKKQEVFLYIFAGLCTGETIAGYLLTKNADSCWASYVSLPTIILSLSLFYFFVHWKPKFSASCTRIVTTCSECTFGIYLVHLWLLTHVFFRVHRFFPNPILTVFISIVITFFVGGGITLIIKKLPIVNKWIV